MERGGDWAKFARRFLIFFWLGIPSWAQASGATSPANWFWTDNWFFVRHRDRAFSLCVDVGMNYTLHPTTVNTPYTAPKMLMTQAHATLWYRNQIGIYGIYSYSPFQPTVGTQFYGGGLKLSFLTLTALSHDSLIKGISVQLVGEFVQYHIVADQTDGLQDYRPDGTVIRAGAAINWGLNNAGLYLNTTMLLSNLQNNLFISPYVGLGLEF